MDVSGGTGVAAFIKGNTTADIFRAVTSAAVTAGKWTKDGTLVAGTATAGFVGLNRPAASSGGFGPFAGFSGNIGDETVDQNANVFFAKTAALQQARSFPSIERFKSVSSGAVTASTGSVAIGSQPGAGLYNRIHGIYLSVYGSGTAPSNTAPISFFLQEDVLDNSFASGNAVATFSVTTAGGVGGNYVVGDFLQQSATSGSGKGFTATVATISGGGIATLVITSSGVGYAVNDTITLTNAHSGTSAVITVSTLGLVVISQTVQTAVANNTIGLGLAPNGLNGALIGSSANHNLRVYWSGVNANITVVVNILYSQGPARASDVQCATGAGAVTGSSASPASQILGIPQIPAVASKSIIFTYVEAFSYAGTTPTATNPVACSVYDGAITTTAVFAGTVAQNNNANTQLIGGQSHMGGIAGTANTVGNCSLAIAGGASSVAPLLMLNVFYRYE
jgi:hypothetical protein